MILEFRSPPLPEQRAIAHVLTDNPRSKNFTRQREIALERERKAALMDVPLFTRHEG